MIAVWLQLGSSTLRTRSGNSHMKVRQLREAERSHVAPPEDCPKPTRGSKTRGSRRLETRPSARANPLQLWSVFTIFLSRRARTGVTVVLAIKRSAMDSSSLQNASTYLNNLLLARGLLRNGKSIDFAAPKKAAGGTDETMAKVINLVHDLVLRRDRDAEQREHLATTIRNLRSEEAQRINEIERLLAKNAEHARNMALAEGHKKSLEISVKKAEASARELKEQMAKMKSTMDQVRAKCVNDVRKRDVEVERLKKHVAGIQRGASQSGRIKPGPYNSQLPLAKNAGDFRSVGSMGNESWSLEQESNDFLTALLNETSTENVALRHIVGETMDTLKELTSLHETQEMPEPDPEIGVPGQYKHSRVNAQSVEQESLVSCEDLAQQMDMVLGHCRAILKDPSFVSIEEVQIREDEIIKLREGWEKMAGRWKEAVTMMDTWRKRMLEGGTTVNLDELSSLGFGKSMAVMPGGEARADEDESSTGLFDEEPEMLNGGTTQNEEQEEEGSEEDPELDVPMPPFPKRLASSPARRGDRLPRPGTAFEDIDGGLQRKQPIFGPSSSTSSGADSGIGSLDGSVDMDTAFERVRSEISMKVGKKHLCCGNVLLIAPIERPSVTAPVRSREAGCDRSRSKRGRENEATRGQRSEKEVFEGSRTEEGQQEEKHTQPSRIGLAHGCAINRDSSVAHPFRNPFFVS
jgi:Afadin- and alpha -actinin-Binding